jgi:hypothetical protein
MYEKYGNAVVGVDFNKEKVLAHRVAGRRVLYGDPTDPNFWMRVDKQEIQLRLVMLTLTKHQANLSATRHLQDLGYLGYISAVAHFDDQIEELREAGVHAAFNFYNEAGLGFAEHAWSFLERKTNEIAG